MTTKADPRTDASPPVRLEVDHFVLAGSDLTRSQEAFADRTGVLLAPGGPHEKMGTRNALARLGDGLYLELLAPDPETATEGNLGGRLSTLDEPTLFAWALRTDQLAGLANALVREGRSPSPIFEATRDQPDGPRLAWNLMGLPGLGGAWPFFIDWRDCAHPSRSAPSVGSLVAFEATLPVPDLGRLPFSDAKGIRLSEGPPALSLTLATPRGTVSWSETDPHGFFG